MVVSFTPRAEKEFRKLPLMAKKKIASTIDRMEEDISQLQIVKLKGSEELYRLHAGRDCVIIFAKQGVDILVARIADRKEVYTDLTTLKRIVKKFLK